MTSTQARTPVIWAKKCQRCSICLGASCIGSAAARRENAGITTTQTASGKSYEIALSFMLSIGCNPWKPLSRADGFPEDKWSETDNIANLAVVKV